MSEKHIFDFMQVLTLIQRTRVTLKLICCSFIMEGIDDVGHVVLPCRLELPAYTADTI